MTATATAVDVAPDTRVVRALILHAEDNVATLLDDGRTQDRCALQGAVAGELTLREPIPYGHKVSLTKMHKGDHVVKYGQVIGLITTDTDPGQHVHIHNVASRRGVKREPASDSSDSGRTRHK